MRVADKCLIGMAPAYDLLPSRPSGIEPSLFFLLSSLLPLLSLLLFIRATSRPLKLRQASLLLLPLLLLLLLL